MNLDEQVVAVESVIVEGGSMADFCIIIMNAFLYKRVLEAIPAI